MPTLAARHDRGSASVEFAALVPLVAVVALFVVQLGLMVASQLVVAHAAREGARAAAVWNDAERARSAALAAGRLDPDRTSIEVSPDERRVGTPVTVLVRYRLPISVPFVERFLPDEVTLNGSATMRTERDATVAGSE